MADDEQNLPGFDIVINCNKVGWGPRCEDEFFSTCLSDLDKCSFDTSSKVEKLGRVCDFTLSQQRLKDASGKYGRTDRVESGEAFRIVDSRPVPKVKFHKFRGRGGLQFNRGGFNNPWGGRGGYMDRYMPGGRGGYQQQRGFDPRGRGRGGGRGGFFRYEQQNRPRREWSVQTKPDWVVEQEIPLASLPKLSLDAKKVEVEDVLWCGEVRAFDKKFDRIHPKAEVPLQRFDSLSFYNITTSQDPHIEKYIATPEIHVAATDHLLACLMAASRSQYSWDIICIRAENKLIFDRRDGCQIDFLTVNETATDPPSPDSKDPNNTPVKLGFEAACINQNFSQLVLDKSDDAKRSFDNPTPFADESDSPAYVGYRYRKFVLPGNDKAATEVAKQPVSLIVRTEVDAYIPAATSSGGSETYASVKALNEYDPKIGLNWRGHLESQSGAVLATEIRNNAAKLGKWVAQAMVAGCETLKLGYVTRSQPKDPFNHSVLGIQTCSTSNLATQISMSNNNAWGVVRSIIDILLQLDEGKYLLLKDPNKSILRLYRIPWETFEEVEEIDIGLGGGGMGAL